MSTDKKTNTIVGGLELLPMVKPLWEELREHHSRVSDDFADSIRKRSFEDRESEFFSKEHDTFRIELVQAEDETQPIGYCISSVSNSLIGEVESLYVKEAYRKQHIGDLLMKNALAWMDEQNVKSKRIGVMAGNDVLKFYEKYGFKVRTYILQQID